MSDAALIELLASYAAALDIAHGSMTIAQALADAHRCGERPPDALVNAYLARVDRDAAKLAERRDKVQQFKRLFRVH